MGNQTMNESLFEDFLIQLEYLALSAEDKIATIESTNEDYKYVRDLLEVIKKSKLAFADGYCNLTKEKENEFKSIITRIIAYPEMLSEVLKEIKNLYYLNQNNLYHKIEIKPQRQKSEQTINQFAEKLTEFTDRVDYHKNKNEIKRLKEYVENIISLANNFEEYGAVKNIDFFQEVIEEVDLSDSEKREIISLALIKNLEMYQREPQEKEELENYESEKITENDERVSKEKIEELLDEMLSEESTKESIETYKKK